jgi:hypothetical protein
MELLSLPEMSEIDVWGDRAIYYQIDAHCKRRDRADD